VSKKGKTKAVIAVGFGILAIFLPVPFIDVLLGIAGLVLAILAKKDGFTGHLRTAGLVCSIIGIVVAGVLTFSEDPNMAYETAQVAVQADAIASEPVSTRQQSQESPAADIHPLIGSWYWLTHDYQYVFHTNGQGTRGFELVRESFEWRTESGGLLIISTPIVNERWSYSIQGDTLTLTSRDLGLTFEYTRVR